MDFSAAGLDGVSVMGFGGAGCATDAISAGSAAKKDDDIAINWALTSDVFGWGCGDDRTDFHALCDVSWVIDLIDDASR